MVTKNKNITLLSVGDIRVDRDNPDSMFAAVAQELKKGDLVFAQLEASYSERGQIAITLIPGFRGHPRNAPAIARAGFNVISVASNHTADYGHDAFVDTIDNLTKAGIKVIGGGRNINEARAPGIFTFGDTKIAMLSYNAILQPGYDARAEWPGMAPLRVKTFYEQIDWQPGTPPKTWTFALPEDVLAIENDIKSARQNADIVVVQMHWGVHYLPDPAMYQIEVGHRIIDIGADILFGHHTHRINPIEVYKGRVIFYGMGGFAFEANPPKKYSYGGGPPTDAPPNPLKDLSGRHAMIVKCDISNKKIQKVSFRPTTANEHHEPRIVPMTDKAAVEIMNYLTKNSIKAKYTVQGDEVVIEQG